MGEKIRNCHKIFDFSTTIFIFSMDTYSYRYKINSGERKQPISCSSPPFCSDQWAKSVKTHKMPPNKGAYVEPQLRETGLASKTSREVRSVGFARRGAESY